MQECLLLILVFDNCFSYFRVFAFHTNFRISLSKPAKKLAEISIRIALIWISFKKRLFFSCHRISGEQVLNKAALKSYIVKGLLLRIYFYFRPTQLLFWQQRKIPDGKVGHLELVQDSLIKFAPSRVLESKETQCSKLAPLGPPMLFGIYTLRFR